MTDHQLAIVGVLLGWYALWKLFYVEARIKIPEYAALTSLAASLIVGAIFAALIKVTA